MWYVCMAPKVEGYEYQVWNGFGWDSEIGHGFPYQDLMYANRVRRDLNKSGYSDLQLLSEQEATHVLRLKRNALLLAFAKGE